MKILLSGINGGIGTEIAKEYLSLGHQVVGIDIQPNLSIKHNDTYYYQCDLCDGHQFKEVLNKINQEHQDIELIINNAGIAHIDHFLDEGIDEFNKVMQINFNSLVFSTYFWLEKMESKGKGHIANMASTAGHIPPAGMCSYSASKHAVVGFTRSLTMELTAKQSPINISLISPGFIKTDIMQIGKKRGFPKQLEFLTIRPEVAAKKIVKELENKSEFIVPDMSGKVMHLLDQFTPGLLQKLNTKVAKRIFRKENE